MTTVSIKGNSGRASKKMFFRRLTTILLVFAVTIFGLFLLRGSGEESQGERMQQSIPQLRDLRRGNTPPTKKKVADANKAPTEAPSEDDESDEEDEPQDPIVELDLQDEAANKPLLSAKVHLISIEVDREAMSEADHDSYAGITAEFCKVDFALHKKDPSSVPMFRYLVEASPGCINGVHYKADLKDFVALARAYDAQERSQVKTLELKGIVFHESRCGSTLAANALAAMKPSENRVYSESAPPIYAVKSVCGEDYKFCSLKQAAQVLQDTVYLMSRSNDPLEKHVFFKIQSMGTRSIEVFQTAFPQTPWIFVYRDPVQVMMSQLAAGAKMANCVRPRGYKSSIASKLAHEKKVKIQDLSDEEYCALHLATITEAAVTAMRREPHLGTPVNYATLPSILYTDIIPNKFGVPLSQAEIDNIIKISSVYSKGSGGRKGEFKDDSKKKEKMASVEVRDAAHLFLDESYAALESGGIRSS